MTLPLRDAREMFEREYLLAQVTRFGGNISRTAAFVGMERSALHRKLKSLGVFDGERGSERGADERGPTSPPPGRLSEANDPRFPCPALPMSTAAISPHRDARVHIEDRGYQFADGVYEVVALHNGIFIDAALHLRGCAARSRELQHRCRR